MHDHNSPLQPDPSNTNAATGAGMPPVQDGPDIMKILADVEGQLNHLRSAQRAQDQAISSFAERSKALRKAEDELKTSQHDVTSLQQTVQQERQQLQQQRQQLDSQSQQNEQRLRARESELEKRSSEIERQSADFQAERDRVAALARQCQQQQEQLSQREREIKSERQELSSRVEQAEKNVGDLIQQIERSDQEITDKNQQLQERSAKVAESQAKLETASKKLAEFAQILSDQTPQLERGASAIAMVQQQQQQIEHLTQQLAEHTLRSDPEEMQRRDQRIVELTEALRQARGQSGGQQGVAELEQRNAELTAEVNQLKLEVQNAQLAADEGRRQLQERADDRGAQTMQDASMAENAAKVAALTAEIEQLHAKAAADLRAQLEAQSRQHATRAAENSKADAALLKKLNARVAELERELEEARSVPAASDSDEQDDFAAKLRQKAERVTAVAEHLRRRRSRLIKLRQLMKQKGAPESVGAPSERMRTEELIKIERERAQVHELRQILANSEKQLVRRWARPKAVLIVASIVLLALCCAAGSWFAADQFFPARVSAAVVLEARNHAHTAVTAQEAEAWRAWHTDLVSDDAFHQTLAKRMAEHRLDQYSDPAKLAKRLQDDLTIDADREGVMILTMAGNDSDEVTAFLDVLTATLVSESNRQMTKRGENVWAAPTGERHEEGQIHYATLNSVPIRDERLARALPIFGGMFAAVLVLVVVAYARLTKAKRVFDEENAMLFT